MVVTTSSFTSGAVSEAEQANIRLIARDEFVKLLRKSQQPTAHAPQDESRNDAD